MNASLLSPHPDLEAARRVLERRTLLVEQARADSDERRDAVARGLRELLPEWEWRPPSGGLGIWVRIPGMDGGRFSRLAAEHGVIVRPGSLFSPDGGCRDYIRIALGETPERLREGVKRLAEAWDRARDQPRMDRPAISLTV